MGLPIVWVVVKYEKMRFLATLRRTTFYISLSRSSAVGTLLNVALLAYVSKGKLYPVQGQANRSSQYIKNRASEEKLLRK